MGTFQDARISSLQRSPGDDGDGDGAPAQVREERLRQQVAALQDELAALRQASLDRDALQDMVAQLREANENLVFAAVNAQSLRDDAEATNRRQNEFLAMLAHELRNPLSPISMAAELLARIPNASAQLLNLTRVIGRHVDHMAHLLDDLLDAARISSGKITLSVQPVLLSEVIEQALETVQPRIDERRQQLAVEMASDAIVIDGDKVRLTQVFSNLLGNASKYTGDAGRIRLCATLDGNRVAVTVDDNGSGIAPDVLPHIFDLFTQGPRALARSEGGLGVGLNVVRSLVSMHGGQVAASSAGPGSGSSFSVILPVSAQSLAPGSAPGSAPDASGGAGLPCRVLLIEDNVDACTTLNNLLAMEGHEVSIAYDGAKGLALALERRYDVVICDIGLPGIDGFEVVQGLRNAPAGGAPLAIAVSGYCQAQDRVRALDAGFDHYLVKPVSPAALLALIASDARRERRS